MTRSDDQRHRKRMNWWWMRNDHDVVSRCSGVDRRRVEFHRCSSNSAVGDDEPFWRRGGGLGRSGSASPTCSNHDEPRVSHRRCLRHSIPPHHRLLCLRRRHPRPSSLLLLLLRISPPPLSAPAGDDPVTLAGCPDHRSKSWNHRHRCARIRLLLTETS